MNQALKLALALAILMAAAVASAQDAPSTEAHAQQAQAELDQATATAPAAPADQPVSAELRQAWMCVHLIENSYESARSASVARDLSPPAVALSQPAASGRP